MSFLQAFYTSCETGLRGSKGFQINAASDGLDASLLQQVERLGLYVPPASAPSRPTEAEIQQFPVALLYQPLNENTGILAQAKYLGQDYSGRFGNYFTHSMVSLDLRHDLTRSGFLPIEMWQSETWQTSQSSTPMLPAMGMPQTGSLITPQAVDQFLREHDRLAHLSSFITAIEGALSTGRRVVIVADTSSVAFWIAAASYSLPSPLALRLSFNTYVKNPYQTEFLIVGTTTDSDFNFAPHEIEHQYYVFDFREHRFTAISEPSSFATQITNAYRGGYAERIADFSRFVDQIAPDLALEEIDVAFACHALLAGFADPGNEVPRITAWCARHLDNFNAEQIQAVLAVAMDGTSVGAEIVAACTDVFSAAQTGNPSSQVRQVIERPYLEWLITDVGARATIDVLASVSDRLQISQRLAGEIEASRMLWLKQIRETPDPNRLYALFALGDKLNSLSEPHEVWRYLGKAKIGPWLSEPAVERLLSDFARRSAIREVIYGIGEYLGTMVAQPQVFSAAAPVLNQPDVFETLVAYVNDSKDLNLFFRLVGSRSSSSAGSDDRLKAFEQCLEVARRFGTLADPGIPGNAFAAVWQDSLPTISEADGLVKVLETLPLADTTIVSRLVVILEVSESGLRDARQKSLARRLSASPIYENLGKHAAKVDAFHVASELMNGGENSVNAITQAFAFLATAAPSLDQESLATVYGLVARLLAHVKDEECHSSLLVKASRDNGSAFFLGTYGQEIINSLAKHSAGKERELSRLIRIWVNTDRIGGASVSNRLFDQVLPHALRDWRVKDLEAVDKGLVRSRTAHLRWIQWREGFREQGPLARMRKWLPFG